MPFLSSEWKHERLISIDPGVMGGTPCIVGTRLTVYAVAARLRTEAPNDLQAEYPNLTVDQIEAAVAYAAAHPFAEVPGSRPWRSKRSSDAA